MSLCKHISRVKNFYNILNVNNVASNIRIFQKPLLELPNNRTSYSSNVRTESSSKEVSGSAAETSSKQLSHSSSTAAEILSRSSNAPADTSSQQASGVPPDLPEEEIQKRLMEFFDEKKNWGETEVKVGRAWKLEELRIKSNSDLHKLWYILLKERNMLMTMEHESDSAMEIFPNPERLDKVAISMENIETIVRERNRAYHLLETGENGERPCIEDTNCFGLKYPRYLRQYFVPQHMNTRWKKEYDLYHKTDDYQYIREFLSKLNEKQINRDYAKKMMKYKEVCEIFKRFPNVDVEALQEQYPELDSEMIERAREDKLSRGNRENLY